MSSSYGSKPRAVAPGIEFILRVHIDLPTRVDGKLWRKLSAPPGWKKRRSAFKERVNFVCDDIDKALTKAQWEEVRATLLMITERAS